MNYQQRLQALIKLSEHLNSITPNSDVVNKAYLHNNWFTPDMQLHAIKYWAYQLQQKQLNQWLLPYAAPLSVQPKTIGVIMAGNIPLVGLHDLLCVLICGHKALVKTSSNDDILIKHITNTLITIEPAFADFIKISDNGFRDGFDAVIATGSNNSNRYFEYYFKHKPNLLRNNRNSVAILSGHETPEDFTKLADDVFMYFGLGCCKVLKLFFPNGFDIHLLFEGFSKNNNIIQHNKYANNYTYHKAIFLMNQTKHLDNGFILLKEDNAMASPLGVLFYSYYQNINQIETYINNNSHNIQCLVSKQAMFKSIPFGLTQKPHLHDYADGMDTINFLLNLN